MKRLFLVGYMGSGKTTIGKALSKKMNLNFTDTDWFMEQRYHKTIRELFETFGEARFREIERQILHEVAEFEDIVIATGGGTPCFSDNMDFMKKKGITIYLSVPPQQLFERLKKQATKRPLLRGKTNEELLDYITRMLEVREPFYNQAEIIHQFNNSGVAESIEALAGKLHSVK